MGGKSRKKSQLHRIELRAEVVGWGHGHGMSGERKRLIPPKDVFTLAYQGSNPR